MVLILYTVVGNFQKVKFSKNSCVFENSFIAKASYSYKVQYYTLEVIIKESINKVQVFDSCRPQYT